ncbi:MAG: sigma-70 family RNA polymerase sigma factor [Siphonobacter sp.]
MQPRAELSDWDGLKQGNEDAFMNIYETHYQAMYSFGCRMYPSQELVKDTIHEVFCELWAKRVDLPSVENVKAYLITYLKRKILKELEKKNAYVEIEKAQFFLSEQSYEDLLIELQTDEHTRLKLKKFLQRLTPAQFEIIRLKYFELLSYEEIATRLELQPRTVYNQISEALKTLRTHFRILSSLFVFVFQL